MGLLAIEIKDVRKTDVDLNFTENCLSSRLHYQQLYSEATVLRSL